jgi:hypothetical protein
MKRLSFSRVPLIVGLVLGLVVAWANAVPNVMSADIFGGTDCGCRWLLNTNCRQWSGCFNKLFNCDMNGSLLQNCVDKTTTCAGVPDDCKKHVEKKCE